MGEGMDVKRRLFVFALVFLGAGGAVTADPFCFATAETFYEQVYCEAGQRGEGASLPPIHEFRNNPPMTQYLLLKRPAARLGIELARPAPPKPRAKSPAPAVAATAAVKREQGDTVASRADSGCRVSAERLDCDGRRFVAVGNQPNSALAPGVLDAGNRMAMEPYSGDPSNGRALARYLLDSYARYLDRMLAIGLGGSTLTLAKFEQLYHNMADMGVDFAGRFERLYGFLKQDKSRIAVDTTVKVPALRPEDCRQVAPELMACASGGRNYLFVPES